MWTQDSGWAARLLAPLSVKPLMGASFFLFGMFLSSSLPLFATSPSTLSRAVAIDTMCDGTETRPSLRMRQFAVNDQNGRFGTDLGACQTNTAVLKQLGYLSYFDGAKWIEAKRDDVAKVFTLKGSREVAGEAIDQALAKIRRLGWRESAYNLGSLLCAFSRVPGPQNGCHDRAVRFSTEYQRRVR